MYSIDMAVILIEGFYIRKLEVLISTINTNKHSISTNKGGTLIIMLIVLIVLISTYKQGSNFLMNVIHCY